MRSQVDPLNCNESSGPCDHRRQLSRYSDCRAWMSHNRAVVGVSLIPLCYCSPEQGAPFIILHPPSISAPVPGLMGLGSASAVLNTVSILAVLGVAPRGGCLMRSWVTWGVLMKPREEFSWRTVEMPRSRQTVPAKERASGDSRASVE